MARLSLAISECCPGLTWARGRNSLFIIEALVKLFFSFIVILSVAKNLMFQAGEDPSLRSG
jgi:hypothetical protein